MIKSLRLAYHNWKVLIKSILYQALLFALVIALGVLIFGHAIEDIVDIVRNNHVQNFVSDAVNSVVNGTFDSEQFSSQLGDLIANLHSAIASVRFPWGDVTVSYVLVCFMFVVYRLLVSVTDVTVGCQLEEFMTSNAERPFTWFFIKEQRRSWTFVLLQTLIALPLDILIVSGCAGFYLMFLLAFNWWTIIPVLAIAVMFYVARLTLFAFCLPSVVCQTELTARQAFKSGMSRVMTHFWHVFWKTLVVTLIMLAISLCSIMFVNNTLLKVALTSVPNFVLFFYLKCVNMVEYFRADNKPFFYKRVEIEGTERYNKRRARQARSK